MDRAIDRATTFEPRASALLTTAVDSADAFAGVYDAYGSRILRYLARRLPDAEIAFDLHQEAFVLAWERRHQFRGTTVEQELAWLYAIARNLILAFIRHGNVERAAIGRLRLERVDLDDRDIRRVTELADLKDLAPAIRAAMQRLPSEQREAIGMRVIEEMSYSEIAGRLDVSNDVVRARVSRGLRTVAEALDGAHSKLTGESA